LRLVVSRADTIVCVSDATRKALRSEISAAAGKAVVAFNGLTYRDRAESRDYQCAPEDAPIEVISFARFVARKNLARCLLAVAALRNRGVPGFRYTIAGSGPLEEELRTTSEQLGLGDVVRFTGRIPDDAIPELYERAAIFLHPQIAEENGKDMEGFGIVIADAMSFGCAVVVGQEGGPRDFVRHGVTGLIVDGTDLQAIVASLESLIIDGEMRDRIGRAARSYALAELSWSKHVKGVLGCPEAVTIEETGAREALDVAAA
jgi:glycosyltransferase involved in cell wall biosynthesis